MSHRLASKGAEYKWYCKEAVEAHEEVHVSSFEAITNRVRVEEYLKGKVVEGERLGGTIRVR
jgi:peptidoglycan hydrolase-like amidase